MKLEVSRNGPKPLYKQIADYYRELIEKGILKDGEPLPNQRDLANQLGVNRSTISNAYSELWSNGLIYSKQGRGTTVVSPNHTFESRIDWKLYHHKRKNMPSPLKAIYRKVEQASLNPSTINLATGNLSLDSFGIIDIRNDHNRNIDKEVFSVILDHLYNIKVKPQNLLLTGGYFQALFLIASAFLKKDDVVVVERPSIFYHHHILKQMGVRMIPIEMDGNGLIPEHLEFLSKRYKIKMLFIEPSFQNPTGTWMPLNRRKQLLAICKDKRIPIVETVCRFPLYHKENGPPSLYSLADDQSLIISVGCFAELLGEGFKMGWMIAPKNSYDLISNRKHELGLTESPLEVKIVGNLLRQKKMKDHLERFRVELDSRKNKMVCLLNKHKEDLIIVHNSEGGKDLWCKVPSITNEEAFLEICMKNGVVVMPGILFGVEPSYIKLSFSIENANQISLGISRLVKSINEIRSINRLEQLTKVD